MLDVKHPFSSFPNQNTTNPTFKKLQIQDLSIWTVNTEVEHLNQVPFDVSHHEEGSPPQSHVTCPTTSTAAEAVIP